jgi:hypothetical protein
VIPATFTARDLVGPQFSSKRRRRAAESLRVRWHPHMSVLHRPIVYTPERSR